MAQGVFQQVVDYPFYLQAIELQVRQFLAQFQFQGNPARLALGHEALLRLGEQVDEVAGRQLEFLHAGLVAREVQQVVDQQDQPRHFLVHRLDQVRFPRLGGEVQAFAEQAEGHLHAGHRGAQLMRGAQDEFAADPLEGSLLGDVAHHQHRADAVSAGVGNRIQRPGQQSRLAGDIHFQVGHRLVLDLALQGLFHSLAQTFIAEDLVDPLAVGVVADEQLADRHWVGVFDAALVVEDHQAIVDAVEHRLQAPLAGKHFLDAGPPVLPQGFGHQAETAGQLADLGEVGRRQGHVEVAFADLVRRARQGLDRRAEAAGDAVGGDEADQQNGHAHQAEQAGDQVGAMAGIGLGGADAGEGQLVQVLQAQAEGVEGFAEVVAVVQRCFEQGLGLRLQLPVGVADAIQRSLFSAVHGIRAPLFENPAEVVLRAFQGLAVGARAKQDDQLVAKQLA